MTTGQITHRLATNADVPELAAMRWEFGMESAQAEGLVPTHDRETLVQTCIAFLRRELASGRWGIWVAVADGQIVSHIYVQVMIKVPKINRLVNHDGYVTNVYTRPAYRNQGIGAELMRHAVDWAAEQDLATLYVWPSAESIPFYKRTGFTESDALQLDSPQERNP